MLRVLHPIGDLAGHAFDCVYAPTADGAYACVSRERAWEEGAPRMPRTPEETVRMFLEALLCGDADEASEYLLDPGSMQRFAQAAGAFDAVTPLPPDGTGESAIGVLHAVDENLAHVRRLICTARQDPLGNWRLTGLEEKPCFLTRSLPESGQGSSV